MNREERERKRKSARYARQWETLRLSGRSPSFSVRRRHRTSEALLSPDRLPLCRDEVVTGAVMLGIRQCRSVPNAAIRSLRIKQGHVAHALKELFVRETEESRTNELDQKVCCVLLQRRWPALQRKGMR